MDFPSCESSESFPARFLAFLAFFLATLTPAALMAMERKLEGVANSDTDTRRIVSPSWKSLIIE